MAAEELQKRLLETFRQWQQESNHRPWSPHHPLRRQALEAFAQFGFPTTRHEDWKYTSLAPALRHPYRIEPPQQLPTSEELVSLLPSLQGMPAPHLWLLNGIPRPGELPSGVAYSNALQGGSEAPIGQVLSPTSETFVALNTAFAPDVAILRIGSDIPELLHVAVVTTADTEPQLANPRLAIVVAPQAKARLLLSLNTFGSNPSLTNAAVEITLGEGAQLELILWETDPNPFFAVTTLGAEVHAHGQLRTWTLALGGALVRNNLYIRLVGPGADAQLFGATMVAGHQVVDHRTLVEHRVEQCTSNQLYKSVADDQATVTFTGRIHVYPGAQKTNAYQSHRAVLLSEKATVNARPQLEIYADDVRCTHGATTGALDQDALFYMRCRGIPEAQARALLLHAFVSEAMASLPDDQLRAHADRLLAERAHIQAEVLP